MLRTSDRFVEMCVVLTIVLSYLAAGLLYSEYFYLLSAVALVVPVFLKDKIKVNRPLLIVMGLISAYGILMSFLGINREKAVRGAGEIIFYTTVYLIFSAADDGKRLLDTVTKALIWCSVFSFVVNISAHFMKILPLVDGKEAFSLVIPYPNTLGLLFAFAAFSCLQKKHPFYVFAHIVCLCGIFCTRSTGVVVIYFVSVCFYLLLNKKYKILTLTVIMLLVGFVAVIHKISFGGFAERQIYYCDAVSIFFDFPLGCGKGGWSSIYPQYQSGVYATENVHSVLFQAMTDYGIIGVVSVVGMIVILLYLCLKCAKVDYPFATNVMISGCMIFGHGMIDADFEFPLILVIVIAMLTSILKQSGLSLHTFNIRNPHKALFVVLGIFFATTAVSWFCYTSGYKNYVNGKTAKAQSELSVAVRLNPCNSSGYYLLYQMSENEEYINRAIKLDRHNPKLFAAIAAKTDDEKMWHKVIDKHPLNIAAYEKLFEIYDRKNEREKIKKLYELYSESAARISPDGKKLKNHYIFKLSAKTENIIRKHQYR